MMQQPIGPVAVFGASNFPLAFSTAGGDTASALAAGCPVVVKGHSAHPGTAEIVAQAIDAAIEPLRHASGRVLPDAGRQARCGRGAGAASADPGGGLHRLAWPAGARCSTCAPRRPDPIPFFGELGSVNPMFLLPHALAARGGGDRRGLGRVADAWGPGSSAPIPASPW